MNTSPSQNVMNPFQKWIVILLSLFLVAAIAAIIVFGFGRRPHGGPRRTDQITNTGKPPIPPVSFSNRLIALDTAEANQKRFDSVSTKYFKTVPYNGVILRNIDVLLSLGLNDQDLLNYVNCEQLRLKTTLAIKRTYGKVKSNSGDSVVVARDSIKVYAHAVDISTGKPVDLYFNKDGSLSYKDGTPWINPCSAAKRSGGAQKPKAVDNGGPYVIDLNNPCPPCD